MKRRFNLLPIADQKSHFIAISTVVMRRLMLNSGILGDEIDQETFNESIDEHRSAVFITSRVIRGIKLAGPQTPPCNGTKKFGNTIETNGVSVCFHVLTWRDKMPGMDEPPKKIRKKKRGATAASEEPSVIYDPTKVVGVDPGRCNISSTVQLQSDGSWNRGDSSRPHQVPPPAHRQAAQQQGAAINMHRTRTTRAPECTTIT
jgi:hypothetical protein